MFLKRPEYSYLAAWEELAEAMEATQARRAAARRAARQRAWMDAIHWAAEANTPAAPVVAFVARREREAFPGLRARDRDRNY